MCLHKMADRLYVNLQKECDRHVSEQLTKLATDQTMDPVLFLGKASNTCSLFQKGLTDHRDMCDSQPMF